MTDRDRGTGLTTEQIRGAPPHAVFIWHDGRIEYPRNLARYLGRDDLTIMSIGTIGEAAERLWGTSEPIVVDHFAYGRLNPRQREEIAYRQERNNPWGQAK